MTASPRIFVVNSPRRRDRATGEFVEMFDLSAATEFGELSFAFPTPNPTPSVASFEALRSFFADYSRDDFLLLVGHPVLLAWATALATERTGGVLSTLNWVGSLARYVNEVVEVGPTSDSRPDPNRLSVLTP